METRQENDFARRRIGRRLFMTSGLQLAVAAGLGARMYQLQVLDSPQYQALADENRINVRLIAPVRGEIFDREGRALAVNRQNYRVLIVREHAEDVEETLDRLARLIHLSERRRLRALREIGDKSAFVPVSVAENLSWEEFAQVNANAPALPGVAADLGWTRHYPEGSLYAHIIGYVGAFAEEDKRRADAQNGVLLLPGMKIGKNGVERVEESRLRGEAGSRRVEVNSVGRVIRELARQEGTPGADLKLTIDLELQRYAINRLSGESGAVVVMDIWNGDVLALASAPGFDPNGFVLGWTQSEWDRLNNNPRRPLSDKAAKGNYPPGSTFKMIVALAALEHGITTRHGVFCNGSMKLGRRTFHCWKRGGHGRVDLNAAIKGSCDVYFYDIAKRVGIERIAETARKLGIGEALPIELPHVGSGLMPTPDWKLAYRDEPWQGGDTLNAGIGQGFVLATPLQLATMTARIANGGYKVQPRLIRAVNGEEIPAPPLETLQLNEEHIDAVKRAMSSVTNDRGGTALQYRIAKPGYEIAGKTGTSQVRRITKAERAAGITRNEDLPWERRDHALFVAFAPLENPRYAISVIVEHGGSGSKAAAPVARDVLLHLLFNGKPPADALAQGAPPPVGFPT